jgi:diaminohydroxyphosphoribosylaminopyrimidine deaminase/5-amino-6-(5-phosphoribosylamino)uracil reductase
MVDELYMRRCLELAELGMGNVSPNPMVGCVIVVDGKIIGEGFHEKFGQAHAEVNAVASVFRNYGTQSEDLLKRATVYVSLEPCAHFGKTPPCVDLLIKHEVQQVIIGNKDPYPDVNGSGIEKLRSAGIAVVVGVLEQECLKLNRRFFTRIAKQRPYIILKWAQTANSYFAPLDERQAWISTAFSKKLVHKWRSEEDAILVGKRTVICDNPNLNTREWSGKNPVRIVIDQKLQIDSSNKVYNEDAKTIIFNEVKTTVNRNIHFIHMEDMRYYLPQKIAFQLYLMDLQSVIIEGGSKILNQFIEAGLWDEARVFHSAANWNEGMLAPQVKGHLTEVVPLNQDKLLIYRNPTNS